MNIIFSFFALTALLAEEESVLRIQSHIVLGDSKGAHDEAKWALASAAMPSKSLLDASVRAFAFSEEEEMAYSTYLLWKETNPTEAEEKALIEEIAWATIRHNAKAGSPLVRAISALAASEQQDSRSLAILMRLQKDSHDEVRRIAILSSAQFPDALMKKALLSRYLVEKEAGCRLALIQAMGKLKMEGERARLYAVIRDTRARMEEKVAAIEALLQMEAPLPLTELEAQLMGSRAAKRLLCRFLARRNMVESKELLQKFLNDEASEVRAEAILAIARLFPEERAQLASHLESPYFAVRLAALFSSLIDGNGKSYVQVMMRIATVQEQLEIAAMLAHAGLQGKVAAEDLLLQVDNPYVKLNLAQIATSPRAQETLYNSITSMDGLWMVEEGSFFPYITESRIGLVPGIVNQPALVDKEIRLELIHRLHLMGDPRALSAMRAFLTKQGWGISIVASLLLTQEGNEFDEEFIRALLNDPKEEIRLQAALFFSLRDQDDSMYLLLAHAYPKLGRDKQEVILSAMGRIPSRAAEEFLIRELNNRHPSIRLIAAMRLLERYYG